MLSAPPPTATTIPPTAVAQQLTQPPPNTRADSYLTAAAAKPPPLPPPPPPPVPLQPTQPNQPTPTAVVVKAHALPSKVHEQRRSAFDLTNVARIMGHNLPTGVKISRDAKQCMCKIASEITGFVAMEASAIAKVNVANGVRPHISF